jgi:glycosyltransferase involved in cell wall biosynthesis
LRVLVICDVLFPQTIGGAGRVAREVAVALRTRGVELQFFTRDTGKKPESESFPITYFPAPGRSRRSTVRKMFLDEIERFQPDLVHIHQPLGAYLAIPHPLQVPYVYTFYAPWADEFVAKASRIPRSVRQLASPLLKAIEGRVIGRAAETIVLSSFSSDQLRHAHQRECVIIPGGIDTSRFHPDRRVDRIHGTQLVTVRNLVPRMGLEELIGAMADLEPSVRLDIAGNGPLREPLEAMVRQLGLNDRVRLLGYVSDGQLPEFYASADWFVLPTKELEGFGMVILESLACGTPVLGTRVGAIPELLNQLDKSWIIDKPERSSIADTVRRVLQTAAPDRKRLREFSLAFDWHQIGGRYHDLFSRILGEKARAGRH